MKKVLFAILALFIAAPGAALAQKGKPLEFDPASTPSVTIILPKQGVEETRDGRLIPIAFDANVDFGRAFSTMGYGVLPLTDFWIDSAKIKAELEDTNRRCLQDILDDTMLAQPAAAQALAEEARLVGYPIPEMYAAIARPDRGSLAMLTIN